jgi:hypothetical protein
MALYQIRLKGKEELTSYDVYLAKDIEDAIIQAKNNYKPEQIESIKLLLCGSDTRKAVEELTISLDGEIAILSDLVERPCNELSKNVSNFADLNLAMELVRDRTAQIFSIMSALYRIKEDTPWKYGYDGEKDNEKEG